MTPAKAGPSTIQSRDGAHVPLRTCIGCRRREPRSSLLRLVAGARPPTPTSVVVLVPDAAGRLPGRGAWIHPTRACLQQAAQRRAFGRALRLTQGVDLEQVRVYLEALEVEHERDASRDDRSGARHDHRRGVGGGTEENRKRVRR